MRNSFYLTLPSNVSLHQEERENALRELRETQEAYEQHVVVFEEKGKEAVRLIKEVKEAEIALDNLAGERPVQKKGGKGGGGGAAAAAKEKHEKDLARFARELRPLEKTYQEKLALLERVKAENHGLKNETRVLEEKLARARIRVEETAENTTNEFTIHLPDPIELEGTGWEVALVELTYPRSWNNIAPGNSIKVYPSNGDENYTAHEVPAGYYDSIDSLLKLIKDKIEPEWTGFDFDELTRRVTVSVDTEAKRVELSEQLAYVLGFEPGQKLVPRQTTAHYPPDLRGGIDSIFVYCNILEPQIIGNTKAPLLRTVGVSGAYGDIVEKIFDLPHYIPLLQRYFSTVKISIYSDQGTPIPFMFGKCIAKLHFRQNKRTLI